ncbi:unnamed protein product [Spirodela intermedia]|uniref:Uncharacterized protein n=1 Tax=Spirodela intermedia TaxID=51605 RepID=A0A7I8JN88_SPIIN|nr:unnamed protein product [Spirodela intermedia]CAA6671609.1 unnamed protein product [Spirodela intermedia]
MTAAAGALLRSRVPSRSLSLTLQSCRRALGGEGSSASPTSRSFLQISSQKRRISCNSRLPVELSCLESMMPLHSAIASARLRSILSAESQSWGMIPQVMLLIQSTTASCTLSLPLFTSVFFG